MSGTSGTRGQVAAPTRWLAAVHVPTAWSGRLDAACAAIFALFILGVAAVAILVPDNDWDMAAYVALAIEDDYQSQQELHAATWKIVRENTNGKEFATLTQLGEYRQAQFADAGNFASQLPMYRVKVAYIALLKVLSPSLGPVLATKAINAASVLLAGGCLLYGLWRARFLQGALFLAPVMMLSGFVLMARGATPDMLMAALTVAGTMLFCSRLAWLGVPVLLGAFLVRPDTIIFLFALVLAALVTRWRRLPALAAFVIAAALTVPMSSAADHIGWWPHFWFSTVEMQADMSDFDPEFSVAVYLKGLASGAAVSLIKYNWVALGILLLLGAWFALRDRRDLPPAIAVPMLAMVLAVGGKFIVFPMPYDRIYGVHLWLFALGLLVLATPRIFAPRGAQVRS
jgi:hypothetical protein